MKFDSGMNLILGPNGAGKTNLLESLSILSGWGAFSRTVNIISWDGEFSHAAVTAELSGEERFNVRADISSKVSLRLDDKIISCTDLRMKLPAILFLTSSINLIDGPPSVRRMFIDRLCSLFYAPYAKRLAEFKYILRTRVLLLKQGKSITRTSVPFCKLGGWIMDARREILLQLKSLMPHDKFTLELSPLLNISGEQYLQEVLQKNLPRELKALKPLCGPGYDDIVMRICENDKPASDTLSRGQKRRLILYIIIMAGKLIALKLKRKPVLLFDDLTAELDLDGREWTYNELVKTGWQVFITAPENPFDDMKISDNVINLMPLKSYNP